MFLHHANLCFVYPSVGEVSLKMSEELVLNSLAALNNISFHASHDSALVKKSLDVARGGRNWKTHPFFTTNER